jgi:hypothetical protein
LLLFVTGSVYQLLKQQSDASTAQDSQSTNRDSHLNLVCREPFCPNAVDGQEVSCQANG